MESLVFWMFLVLVNGTGTVGASYGTETECSEALVDASKSDDALAVSPCLSVTMTAVPKKI